MNNDLKRQIAGSFSLYSKSYDQYAKLQKESALCLVDHIVEGHDKLVSGPILEIGCGSGLLSETLASLFSDRDLVLVDMAPGMLNECRNRLLTAGYPSSKIQFIEMDAETISAVDKYALIVSGLTLQWFHNIQTGIIKLVDALVPGGRLICSFLGAGSFAEWVYHCKKNRVYCTLNPMPDYEALVPFLKAHACSIDHLQKKIVLEYSSVMDFFLSLKKTGTGVNISGKSLTTSEMRKLIVNWEQACPGKIKLTCIVDYLTIVK